MVDGSAYEAVKTAIELGYRHIDCAHIYGNEQDVGRALNECIQSGLVRRDELWITSKLWNDSHPAASVKPALELTLENLQLEALDLYLIHWPVVHQTGVYVPESPEQLIPLSDVPISETWNAMEQCVTAGLCRNIGVSNFSRKKLSELIQHATIKPAFNQVESHPFLQQTELLNFCTENQMLMTAYSPLGSADRPDRMKSENEPSLLGHPVINEIATKNSITPAQTLLAWNICRGAVTIPKSTNRQRMQENLAAASIDLADADMQTIATLNRNYRFVDGRFCQLPGSSYTYESLWDEPDLRTG